MSRLLALACCLGLLSSSQVEAQETESPERVHMVGVTGGLGTWDGNGAIGHFSVSVEDHWDSGLGLAAEGGFAVGGGVLVGTLTPGAFLNLTRSSSPPFVRGGFSLVGSAVGFHVGAGLKTATRSNGIRVEGRIHVFPGDDADFMLEALVTYQVRF